MQAGTVEGGEARVVLAIARGGSLNAAAKLLGVDATTVSRKLRSLERALNARPFHRVGLLLVPTEIGRMILARAERIEAELLGLTADIDGAAQRCAGTVRVSAVPVVANHLIVPNLPGLLPAYPDLRIEVAAESINVRLRDREADLAIRLARPKTDTALCRRVGTLSYSIYAPAEAEALDALPWITYDDAHADLPQARWVAARNDRPGPAGVRVADAATMLAAVRAGLGRAILPDFVAAVDPCLKRVCADAPVVSREMWLLMHPDLRALRRAQVVSTWLIGLCRAISNA